MPGGARLRALEQHVEARWHENSIVVAKVFSVGYNALMQRTIRIQLQPSPSQAVALAETSRQFTAAFNRFVELGWLNGVSNATKLQFLAYYAVREALPELKSNLSNTARAKAAEALRSAFTLCKDRDQQLSMPRATACPPRYNSHTYRVDWQSQTVRMSLVGGRQTIRFRRSQSDFWCRQCGYHLNADLNGARNIAAKYRTSRGISPAGGLCNQPIVSTSDSFGGEAQAAPF